MEWRTTNPSLRCVISAWLTASPSEQKKREPSFFSLFLEDFPLLGALLPFTVRTTLARPQALHVCIDEAKTVFTGRARDNFGQMGRREDNTPLAMGQRDGHHPNYYTADL